MTTEKQPPTPCSVCTKAYALKQADPDGGRRCFAHSTSPAVAAKREAIGAKGAAQGARQKGVPSDMRKPVLAGVVDIDEVRAQAHAAKVKEKAREEAQPIPLDSKGAVLGFLGQTAGSLMGGALEAAQANAAASLARVALAALGLEEQDDANSEEAPRGFSYETTTGDKVAVRGRGDGRVH